MDVRSGATGAGASAGAGAGGERAALFRNVERRCTAVGMSNAHIVGNHGSSEAESRGMFSRCAFRYLEWQG
jgi:hypothetical protein